MKEIQSFEFLTKCPELFSSTVLKLLVLQRSRQTRVDWHSIQRSWQSKGFSNFYNHALSLQGETKGTAGRSAVTSERPGCRMLAPSSVIGPLCYILSMWTTASTMQQIYYRQSNPEIIGRKPLLCGTRSAHLTTGDSTRATALKINSRPHYCTCANVWLQNVIQHTPVAVTSSGSFMR